MKRVLLAFPSYTPPPDVEIPFRWMDLAVALERDGVAWERAAVCLSPYFGQVMNDLIHQFMTSECDRLFFLDMDILFRAEDALRLIKSDLPVVGGDYQLRNGSGRTAGERLPGGREVGPLIEMRRLGTGFLAIDRSVIEDMQRANPHTIYTRSDEEADAGQLTYSLFDTEHADGLHWKDDVVFFKRLRACGYRVWCDQSVKLGHVGIHSYGGRP